MGSVPLSPSRRCPASGRRWRRIARRSGSARRSAGRWPRAGCRSCRRTCCRRGSRRRSSRRSCRSSVGRTAERSRSAQPGAACSLVYVSATQWPKLRAQVRNSHADRACVAVRCLLRYGSANQWPLCTWASKLRAGGERPRGGDRWRRAGPNTGSRPARPGGAFPPARSRGWCQRTAPCARPDRDAPRAQHRGDHSPVGRRHRGREGCRGACPSRRREIGLTKTEAHMTASEGGAADRGRAAGADASGRPGGGAHSAARDRQAPGRTDPSVRGMGDPLPGSGCSSSEICCAPGSSSRRDESGPVGRVIEKVGDLITLMPRARSSSAARGSSRTRRARSSHHGAPKSRANVAAVRADSAEPVVHASSSAADARISGVASDSAANSAERFAAIVAGSVRPASSQARTSVSAALT